MGGSQGNTTTQMIVVVSFQIKELLSSRRSVSDAIDDHGPATSAS